MGHAGALVLWTFVCFTAFFVCQTALQAASRTIYAFSRDRGLPDRGIMSKNSSWTQTPLIAIWFTTLISIIPGLLDLASPIAANAIFALTAMALDLSYIIPIFLSVDLFYFCHCMLIGTRRRLYRNHPEVVFKPGPFYLGDGLLGWAFNINCICWTLFVFVIFSFPTIRPITKDNMNYASVCCFLGFNVLGGLLTLVGGVR